MQSSQYRCLILIAVLVAGWGLLTATQRVQAAEARWPSDDALFNVPGWITGPATTDNPFGKMRVVSRRYFSSTGTGALLVLKTNPEANNIYRTGAEVSFLGAGYGVEPAPAGLVPPAAERQALLASRESERWLVLYAHGEHRGFLGNGAAAWGFAALDGVLGAPNDYYVVSLQIRLDDLDPMKAAAAASLADTLFPRVAAWYAN